MRSLAFDGSIHTVIFVLAYAAWWVPETIGSIFQRSARRHGTRRDRGSYALLVALLSIGMLLGFGIAVVLRWATIPVLREPLFWLGIICLLAGVVLRWYAIRILGRFFTRDVATQPGQTVVQDGLYRFIRHPAYSGTLLTLLGIGLALGNWLSLLVIMAGGLIGHLYRIRVEEQVLVDTIGTPYQEYMRRTRRLIPYVW